MEPILQYDLFIEHTPYDEQNLRIDNLKDSLDKVRKRLFAQDDDIMKLILKQHKRIEELEERLNRLTHSKIREVK